MRRIGFAIVMAFVLALGAGQAQADPHDPERTGHPLRVAGYLLHPVGAVADLLVFRPAHWLVHRHRLVESLFGHTN